MEKLLVVRMIWCLSVALLSAGSLARAATFRVATYNLENYRLVATNSRPAKPLASRQRIWHALATLRADVLALQELGSRAALDELAGQLEAVGIAYPHREFVDGADPHIHLAVLSRFPIDARRPHTDQGFLLQGKRFQVSRGFAEVAIRGPDDYRFTLITAHLKSKRPVPFADQEDLREEEARLLRELVDRRLQENPNLNLVVLGDLNDFKDSRSTKRVLGRGRRALIDLRPEERNGDSGWSAQPSYEPRTVTWTHYYGKEDTYARIDYILVSRGMAREEVRAGTRVLAFPDWGVASDHRPIVAEFSARDQ